MQITKDKVVAFDYTLTDDAGQLLDTSEGREPLHYLHGAGNIIEGLENALEGKAAGEVIQYFPNGKNSRLPLVVIRLRNRSLELGYMNQMNPRGVLLVSFDPIDDLQPKRLEGEMSLRGVRFELPKGMTLPKITVRVAR